MAATSPAGAESWPAAPLNAEAEGEAGDTGLEGAAVPTGAAVDTVLLAKTGLTLEAAAGATAALVMGAAELTATDEAAGATAAEVATTGAALLETTAGTLVAGAAELTGLVRVQGQLVMVRVVASVTV